MKTVVSFPKGHQKGFLTIAEQGRHQGWKTPGAAPQALSQAPQQAYQHTAVAKIALILAFVIAAYVAGFYWGGTVERQDHQKFYHQPVTNAQPAGTAAPSPTAVPGGSYSVEVSAKEMTSGYLHDSLGCFTYTSQGNKRYVAPGLCN